MGEVNTDTTQTGGSQTSVSDVGATGDAGAQASAAASTGAQGTANAQATDGAAGVVGEYTPNYKFKVGEEEKEFDEFVRGAIKDSESEKKLRDLYTKAHGLDSLKTRLTGEVESWKGKAGEHVEKYSQLSQSLSNLSHMVNRGDFDSFFDALKIPEAAVYKWVNRKIQEQEMSPEQKADLARQREEGNRLFALERQNQDLMQRQQSFQLEQNRMLLDATLSQNDVAPIAQAFDEKVGAPGAFRNEVLKRGVALYHIHGRDLPPAEVVQDLLQTMGKVFQPGQVVQGGQTHVAPGQKPPVIPNVSAKSGSPVKSAPKSIKELKERASLMG